MDKELKSYLLQVERYLKSMPSSERSDIIKELYGYIEELHVKKGKTAQEILLQIGSPRELALAYLGDSISKTKSFNLRKFCMALSFYSLAGVSIMFLLPVFSVLSVGLMLQG